MQIFKIHLRKVKGAADKYGDKGTKDEKPRMCVSSYSTDSYGPLSFVSSAKSIAPDLEWADAGAY